MFLFAALCKVPHSLDLHQDLTNFLFFFISKATPRTYNFGILRFGSEARTAFTLFNFGRSPLHILLKYEIPDELKRTVIDITPLRTTLGYREKCTIKIQMKAMELGVYCIKILYFLRLNEISDVLIKQEGQQIFTFDFQCFWPVLHVKTTFL